MKVEGELQEFVEAVRAKFIPQWGLPEMEGARGVVHVELKS